MSEDEYEFEGDDDYVIEDDGDEPMEDAEADVQNLFYSAKDEIETNPDGAFEQLKEVILKDDRSSKWTYKALKQIVKCCYALKRVDDLLQYYSELIVYNWKEKTRSHTEKSINKCIDIVSDVDIQRKLLECTLNTVADDKALDKHVFNIRVKLCQLELDCKNFAKVEEHCRKLTEFCIGIDGLPDSKMGTNFIIAKSLEIQMYTEKGDNKKLKVLYEEALKIMESAIPPPKFLGIIRECGGKLLMRQGQFVEASTAFFHAFKSYDEAGQARRTQCLKYLVLATLLSSSHIDPFDSQEAKPYKNDAEIAVMTELVEGFRDGDIHRVERVISSTQCRKSILDDPFIVQFIDPLLITVRTKILISITKPYTMIKIESLSQYLKIPYEDCEKLLVNLILDNKLMGRIDQVNRTLVTERSEEMGKINSMHKMAVQLNLVRANAINKLVLAP